MTFAGLDLKFGCVGADVLGLALTQRDNISTLDLLVLTALTIFFGSFDSHEDFESTISVMQLLKDFALIQSICFFTICWLWWQ